MMFTIEVSTHPRNEDKFVRLITDIGIVTMPLPEWSHALATSGQCSPSGRPTDGPPGGTPVAERLAA